MQKIVKIIQGENNSKAVLFDDPQEPYWQVYGDQGVLESQNDDEYAYRLSTKLDWQKLPLDTPIYAGVNNFETGVRPTQDFSTVADFLQAAQEIIRNVTPTEIDWKLLHNSYPNAQLKFLPANDLNAIINVVNCTLDFLSWETLNTVIPEIANDIEEQPDAYPSLFNLN